MAAQTVHIVDDDQDLVRALATRCRELGLNVRASYNGMEAVYDLTSLAQNPPSLIILDINLPLDSGLSVCEMLQDDSVLAPIPVIVLTGDSNPETRQHCEELGVYYLLKSSHTWDQLEPIIRQLLGMPARHGGASAASASSGQVAEPTRPTVLCIDDDRHFCKAMAIRLGAYGIATIEAFHGVQGFWKAIRERPNVIIADFSMPANGSFLIRSLKSLALTKDIPIIIVTGKTDSHLKSEMLTLGAAEFFTKPPNFEQLVEKLRTYIRFSKRPHRPHSASAVPSVPRGQVKIVPSEERWPVADAKAAAPTYQESSLIEGANS